MFSQEKDSRRSEGEEGVVKISGGGGSYVCQDRLRVTWSWVKSLVE